MKVGSLEVWTLVDAVGSFATMSEVFPVLPSDEEWWLPINVVLVRGAENTVLVDTGLGPHPRSFMPDAEVHEDDWAFFMTEEALVDRPHLRENVLPLDIAGRVDLVAGETEVARGVRIIPTPGHTPGHLSVRLESQGRSFFVLGDVVVHEVQVGEPDIAYVSDHDSERAAATRRHILGELADEGTDVIVSHFDGTGRFARAGEGFRWTTMGKEDGAPVE